MAIDSWEVSYISVNISDLEHLRHYLLVGWNLTMDEVESLEGRLEIRWRCGRTGAQGWKMINDLNR